MVSFAHSLRDDDICISEEVIGRLHHASEDSILDLVSTLRASERANLAMHCYRKSHLRQIGLTIATTCDLKSRRPSEEPSRLWGRPRPTITLACSAGGSYPAPIDLDDMPGEQGMTGEQGMPA